jgi:hypothetical protein
MREASSYRAALRNRCRADKMPWKYFQRLFPREFLSKRGRRQNAQHAKTEANRQVERAYADMPR